MRKFIKPASLFLGMGLFLLSCSGEATAEGEAPAEDVMTTEAFIEGANKLGYDEFTKKYPNGTEVTLQGEVRAPATWDDKIDAKFGSGLNDLPLTATFMFADNGGTKESTKEKVGAGKTIVFTGKVNGSFYMNDKLNRVTFDACVVQ
jgi:ABC-type glycerol-3-phosphate transport system substrate-binding protein